jgi:antirestriction protein
MKHEPPLGGEQPPQPIDPPAAQEAAGTPAESPLPTHEAHEQELSLLPQIWVGSLSDYNNGQLYGAWIDAAREPEQLQADIATMLAGSPWAARTGEPAEEWGVFDTENFGGCRIDQHENLDWISNVAKGIKQHGLAFAAWADVVEEPERLTEFDKAYQGHYDSVTAYVEQLINDLGYDELLDRVVPTTLRPYVKIDVAATARDLLFGGDLQALEAAEGGVWIFNACY